MGDWFEKHPWETAGMVFGAGVLFLIYYYYYGGGSTATSATASGNNAPATYTGSALPMRAPAPAAGTSANDVEIAKLKYGNLDLVSNNAVKAVDLQEQGKSTRDATDASYKYWGDMNNHFWDYSNNGLTKFYDYYTPPTNNPRVISAITGNQVSGING